MGGVCSGEEERSRGMQKLLVLNDELDQVSVGC